jgi:hypothetical protein
LPTATIILEVIFVNTISLGYWRDEIMETIYTTGAVWGGHT